MARQAFGDLLYLTAELLFRVGDGGVGIAIDKRFTSGDTFF